MYNMLIISNYKYNKLHVSKVNCIELSDLRVRFVLEIETNTKIENSSVLVVMKNPSKATTYQSDKTINNVIENLHSQYNKIYIVNLYPYYSSNAKGLVSFFDCADNKTILEINDYYIEKYEQLANDILIGWGTNTIGIKNNEYDGRISTVMNLLRKNNKPMYYVHCCKCKNNMTGCGNNTNCSTRCKKRCKRSIVTKSKSCSIIRYPMHLELWDTQKKKLRY